MDRALIITLSANGSFGIGGKRTFDWTSKEDKLWFKEITKRYRVIVTGRLTFETFGTSLSGRILYVITRDPSRIKKLTDVHPVTLAEFKALDLNSYCLIGGISMINQLFDELDTLYISRHKHVEIPGEEFDLDLDSFELEHIEEGKEITKYRYRRRAK